MIPPVQSRWSSLVVLTLSLAFFLGFDADRPRAPAEDKAAGKSLVGGWSNWRGPAENGVSSATDLPEKFSITPKGKDGNLIWRVPYGGRSTPIVQNGRVFVINSVGGEGDTPESRLQVQERMMCFDADTGATLWERRFNVWHTDIVAVRLGWTNLVGDPETGNIYAHGSQGLFLCLDKDGKTVWQHSLTEEFGRISGYGGRMTSPVLDGDLVILGMLNANWGDQAPGRNRFLACDKRTGAVVWWSTTGFQPKDTYSSTPVVAEVAGQRLVISGGGDGGVHAFKVRTGEKVWSYIFGSAAVNCSPVVDGDMIYIGQGEDNADGGGQGRVVCLDGSKVEGGKPKLVWKVDGLKAKFTSPVIHQGRLYITDELGRLFCLNAKDGTELWQYTYGRNSKGSPVLAEGKLYLPEVDAKLHVLIPGDTECKEAFNVFFRKKAGGADVEINGSVAIASNRLYFMTSDDLFCVGKKDAPVSAPPVAAAAPAKGTGEPTALQIVPADVQLHPGEKIELKAYAFDSKGLPLGEAKVDEWSLAAMSLPPPAPNAPKPPPNAAAPPVLVGTIEPKAGATTTLTIGKEKAPPAQFGRVLAKMGSLTAECRVRVIPTLPYKPNFENIPVGRTPGGWVNTMGKFVMAETSQGSMKVHALKKLATNANPLVARANAYMAGPDLTNYTISADLMGTQVGKDMPDAGVVANRYTLVLFGNTQQLRLISYDAIPRVDKTIEFPWKPDTWYSLKLTAQVEGDKATIKGKCWPTGEKEPEAWTVEFVDPVPNREGAPALYGYATGIKGGGTGSEAFFKNVQVVPNKAD